MFIFLKNCILMKGAKIYKGAAVLIKFEHEGL